MGVSLQDVRGGRRRDVAWPVPSAPMSVALTHRACACSVHIPTGIPSCMYTRMFLLANVYQLFMHTICHSSYMVYIPAIIFLLILNHTLTIHTLP